MVSCEHVHCCVGSLLDDGAEMVAASGAVTSPLPSEPATTNTSCPVGTLSPVNVCVDAHTSVSLTETTDTCSDGFSHQVTNSFSGTILPPLSPATTVNTGPYHLPHISMQPSSTTDNGGFESAPDNTRPFYQPDDDQQSSAQQHGSGNTVTVELTGAGRSLSYTASELSGAYPLLPMRSDGPVQSSCLAVSDGVSYMGSVVMSTGCLEPPRAPPVIDSSSSYSMSLPPYPGTATDEQSKPVNRIPTYLPPYAETARTIESSMIYGRPMPAVAPALPSDAFAKDFFGQYLQDTPAGPLHPLATHGTLHDQRGILTGYQQSSTLPTMPHGSGGSSELFRRVYSSVSDNLFGGMKSVAPATQSQHWMSPADAPRRWNASPPSMNPTDMSRYSYPPGRTELADTAKTLPPAPAPMSKRPGDIATMFASASSTLSSSVHYPLSGGVYTGPPPYPHPSLPTAVGSSHRQLEDAYRQMTAADYRSLAHHRSPSEMYGSALSSLDRYYYSARDAMYRSQQLAAAAAFIPQNRISSQYTADRRGAAVGYVHESLPAYAQCPTPTTYGLVYPPATDKHYLAPSSSAMRPMDYLDNAGTQDSYAGHTSSSSSSSVIYNMMPRYF